MTITIPEPQIFVTAFGPFVVFLMLVAALLTMAWWSSSPCIGKAPDRRDEAIRVLNGRIDTFDRERAALVRGRDAAEARAAALEADLGALRDRIGRAAALLAEGDRAGADEPGELPAVESAPASSVPLVSSNLYACSIDDARRFGAYLIRAGSYDEAYGKAHRIAGEKGFADDRCIDVTGEVTEPKGPA